LIYSQFLNDVERVIVVKRQIGNLICQRYHG